MLALDFQVVDAEYSDALDRIVLVSASPDRIHIFDPLTAADASVALALAPTSVSVGPDGLFAAVGHDGWVSYVDLQAGLVVRTLAVSAPVGDLVLAGNGFVYVFPDRDQWESIRCINVATGQETLSTGNLIFEDTRARLHPGGTAIYGANRGLSPSDIEKYSITGSGTAAYLYNSPYHGDYQMCGNLWIAEHGLRIFTACGRVFRASSVVAEDMTYNGSLTGATHVRDAVHSSEAGKLLVIADQTATSDTAVQVYDDAYLGFEGTLPLPNFVLPTGSYSAHGRFVFFSRDGTRRFAVVQADASSGLLYDFAVVSFDADLSVPCNVTLDAASYSTGEIVTMSVFRVANPSPVSVAVELKLWLSTPYGDHPILSLGADGSLVLSPGYDADFGPVPLFWLAPETPTGSYGIHCRVLEAVTGKSRHLDENGFAVH